MWKDVHIASDEVAIIWGQTATQASAGLFRPATYRVVCLCMPDDAHKHSNKFDHIPDGNFCQLQPLLLAELKHFMFFFEYDLSS